MLSFIEEYKNALTSTECKKIIEYMNSTELSPGIVGGGVNREIKDSFDRTMWLDADDGCGASEINKLINVCLKKWSCVYTEKYHQLKNIHKWDLDIVYNLQKYNPRQCYHKSHCENSGYPSTSNRMLAWMIYLNTVNDEGGTFFDNFGLKTKAIEGSLLIWPAYWTHHHRGIPSPTETKYIATGWFSFLINN